MFEARGRAPEQLATQRLSVSVYAFGVAAGLAVDAVHFSKYARSHMENLVAPTLMMVLSLFWLLLVLKSGPPTKRMFSTQCFILVLLSGVDNFIHLLRM